MRYLKMFESINGWEEIPRSEFNDIIRDSPHDSLVKDISVEKMLKLKSLYLGLIELDGGTTLPSIFRQNIHTPGYLYENKKKFIRITATNEYDIDLYIFELEDDWYYVYKRGGWNYNYPNTCYRCDQFDGLINCLDNHLLRKYKPTPKKPFFKRVKKFLGMNESVELYKKITFIEYDANVPWSTLSSEAFTKRESDVLFKLGFIDKRKWDIPQSHNKKLVYHFLNFGISVLVEKTDDNWYYVNFQTSSNTDKYYKCDQFDGLLACLKKEFNIENKN